MKYIILVIALMAQSTVGQVVQSVVGLGRNQPSANRIPRYHNHPLTPLLFEDFENPTGYDLAGWGESIGGTGVVNEDYTATVLFGTQSLLVDEAGDDPTFTTNSFAASGHVWMAFRFRPTFFSGGSIDTVLQLTDADNTCQMRMTLDDEGNVRLQFPCGTGTVGNYLMSLNTTYTVWIEYFKDNGANSYGMLAFSTTPVKPLPGQPNYSEGTSTSTATDVSRIQIGKTNFEGGEDVDFIIDHLLIDDVEIGNWP